MGRRLSLRVTPCQGKRPTPLVERGLANWALATLCRDLRTGLTARLEVLLDAYAQPFFAQHGIDKRLDCHAPLSLLVDLHLPSRG
jgi:hypothetical protein